MTDKRKENISKFLSLILRHKPDEIGIELDHAGWVDVDRLLKAMEKHGTHVTREELEAVVATNHKKRFAFSEDGKRIRANQGHSVEVDLGLPPMVPPEVLYHGTATRFVQAILKEGLRKIERGHVHLCVDIPTASEVGERHGKLAMLQVRAGEMHRAGMVFYRSANGVWLTEMVPADFIERMDSPS